MGGKTEVVLPSTKIDLNFRKITPDAAWQNGFEEGKSGFGEIYLLL